MMDPWKVFQSKYIHESRFGNIRLDDCQLPRGGIIKDYFIFELANWVNAIMLTKDNQLILTRQYRHGTKRSHIEIPAGRIEDGECAKQAILREVREETGYISDKDPILLGVYDVNSALQKNTITTYLMQDAYLMQEQDLDEQEQIDVIVKDVHEVEQLIHTGRMTQLFSVTAFYLAKDYLERNRN